MKRTSDLSFLYQNLIETFEEVKSAVQQNERRSRAGLMLGLQEIGASLEGFIGAYYPIASNIIIVNKTPLRRILETDKTLLKPYIFHVLLHEYIHALGFLDEETTGQKTSKKHYPYTNRWILGRQKSRQRFFARNPTYHLPKTALKMQSRLTHNGFHYVFF